MISRYVAEAAGTITKEAIDSFRKEFNSKFGLLAEEDRDTLYFDGFAGIRSEIKEIRKRILLPSPLVQLLRSKIVDINLKIA